MCVCGAYYLSVCFVRALSLLVFVVCVWCVCVSHKLILLTLLNCQAELCSQLKCSLTNVKAGNDLHNTFPITQFDVSASQRNVGILHFLDTSSSAC